jgi:hypothetical protein
VLDFIQVAHAELRAVVVVAEGAGIIRTATSEGQIITASLTRRPYYAGSGKRQSFPLVTAFAGTGDDKSTTTIFLDIVQGRVINKHSYVFIHEYVYAVDTDWFFICFRLIQSQPKTGPPSAHPLYEDPDMLIGMLI